MSMSDLQREKEDKDSKNNYFSSHGEGQSATELEKDDQIDTMFQRIQNLSQSKESQKGRTATNSDMISSSTDSGNQSITINVYKDGFCVNDGPLRSLKDPAGLRFMSSIAEGRIPVELVDHYGKQEVNVVLNRHDCTFESKKEQSNFPVTSSSTSSSFAGVGRKLGDGCLTPETDSSSESSSCIIPRKIELDSALPSDRVSIRLLTGLRETVQINPQKHTIGDLRAHVSTLTSPGTAFILLDVDRNELKDDSLTLEQADVINTMLLQVSK